MAVAENASEQTSTSYIEPDVERIPRVSKEEAGRICAELAYRVLAIDGNQVKIEPLQDGVLRYPPVRVQVPHDPDFVERYVNMGWNIPPKPSNT